MSKGSIAVSALLALIVSFFVGYVTTPQTRSRWGERARVAFAAHRNSESMDDAERIPVGASPVLGPDDALVTIVQFGDFQCPFCSRVETTLHQIRQRYGRDVRVVWKNAPLPFHPNAGPAAEAAMEAMAQRGHDGFWRMHDLLYREQQHLDAATLEHLALEAGLDLTRFRAALNDHRLRASIDRDVALAQAIGAQGTPNFFINGTQVSGAQSFDRFERIIDDVIARARTIKPRRRVYAAMVADPVENPVENPDSRRPPTGCGGRWPQEDPTRRWPVPVGRSPVQGPNTALVTMVIFGDFQCPFCARTSDTLAQLRARYGNDLRVVWKNEPLPFHEASRPAAELAMEAFAQRGNEGFWQVHRLLFDHQSALDRGHLDGYALRSGLDMDRYTAAMNAHTHVALIDADHALGQTVEVNGVPHFFINGFRLVGAQALDAFISAIDEERRRAAEFMRAHPDVTRADLYERMVLHPPVPTPAPPVDEESRVYTVRDDRRAPSFGPSDARVVIQHFADYQCPFSSRVGPTIERIRRRYGDRVRFVWRDYPLPFHPAAMLAAEAAREAYAQRGNPGFWRFHDHLFEHPQHIEREDLERYAREQGLDVDRFRAALDHHIHKPRVEEDMAVADATGASIGTPAFFIGGRFVAGALAFEEFERRIEAALRFARDAEVRRLDR